VSAALVPLPMGVHLMHNLGVKAAPQIHQEQAISGRAGVEFDEPALRDRFHQTLDVASETQIPGKQIRGTRRKKGYWHSLLGPVHQLRSRSISTHSNKRAEPTRTMEPIRLGGNLGQVRENLDVESALTQ
jgi:hypothetical protein